MNRFDAHEPAQSLPEHGRILGVDGTLFNDKVTETNATKAPRHMMLAHPEQWFSENPNKWERCFMGRRKDLVTIGCADPRVAHSAQLRYAGLGVVDGSLDRAAEKIIRLREGVLSDCAITLESHDLCAAIRAIVSRHPRAGEVDCDAFAEWWGAELAQIINDRSPGIPVKHQHLSRSRMQEQRPIEALYVDCTDEFNTTDDVPYGHTISLLNPQGIAFSMGVALRNIVGMGMSSHLEPQVKFMMERIRQVYTYSEENPLTLVVVRDRRRRFLSDVVQQMAHELAKEHGREMNLIGVNQRGKLHVLQEYNQRHHLA